MRVGFTAYKLGFGSKPPGPGNQEGGKSPIPTSGISGATVALANGMVLELVEQVAPSPKSAGGILLPDAERVKIILDMPGPKPKLTVTGRRGLARSKKQ